MADEIKSLARDLFGKLGYTISRTPSVGPPATVPPEPVPPDIDPEDIAVFRSVEPFTMTSPERVHALCASVRHVVKHDIPGSIVECGVWRGGSMMAAALTLARYRVLRTLYLFDTFEGMPPPTEHDVENHSGRPASDVLDRSDKNSLFVAKASLDDVKRNLSLTGYPSDRLVFTPGKVEDTIPLAAPETIAILRLDTDWYESTKHELIHLWPRLVTGGILIIDDYGYWSGARKAVDEYFADMPVFLNRIDCTGRLVIKA